MKLCYTELQLIMAQELVDTQCWGFSEIYTTSGEPWYKFYVFIYSFGYISIEDLSLVFKEENSKADKNADELKNIFRSRVNYWVKSGDLKKIEKNGYVLSRIGLKKLYEYMAEKSSVFKEKISFEEFEKEYFATKKNFLHARNMTSSVLKMLELMKGGFFACEPVINSKSEVLIGKYREFEDRVVIPDAVIGSIYGDNIFVEADNGTERKNSSLIPKLTSYGIVIGSEPEECSDATIHFTVWPKCERSNYVNEAYDAMRAVHLYRYVQLMTDNTMSFQEFTKKNHKYYGGIDFGFSRRPCDIFTAEGFSTPQEMVNYVIGERIKSSFSQHFLTRQKYIFDAALKASLFRFRMLKGTRMVCVPTDVPSKLLECIYFEHTPSSYMMSFFKYLTFSVDGRFFLHNKKKFIELRTGNEYYFRNVFQLRKPGAYKPFYVVVENISEDLSGRYRIANFVKTCRELDEDVHFVCLYNGLTVKDPAALVGGGKTVGGRYEMEFYSYDDYFAMSRCK